MLTVQQKKAIVSACEDIWQGIAPDIPEVSVSSYEMIELSADADRLTTFGHAEEHANFKDLVSTMGYQAAVTNLSEFCTYDGYEAGGSMAL